MNGFCLTSNMLDFVWWLRREMRVLCGGYWISAWENAAYSQPKDRLGAWSLSPQSVTAFLLLSTEQKLALSTQQLPILLKHSVPYQRLQTWWGFWFIHQNSSSSKEKCIPLFHTNMPVQSPLLFRWGADFHARNPALCQIPLFFLELWRYIMMLINSFLKKRVIASIGSNFINAGNEGK